MTNPPFEYWDPKEGQEITIEPVRYELGTGTFTPQGRAEKSIEVVRIWVDKDPPRAAPLNYWDFSGHRLKARLLPILPGVIQRKGKITLIRQGTGLATDYQVTTGA